jgi:hypothetical protein
MQEVSIMSGAFTFGRQKHWPSTQGQVKVEVNIGGMWDLKSKRRENVDRLLIQ